MQPFGKALLVAGAVAAGVGLWLMVSDKIPLLWKLPGDFTIRIGNVYIYLPITTGILLSLVISLMLWLVSCFRGE